MMIKGQRVFLIHEYNILFRLLQYSGGQVGNRTYVNKANALFYHTNNALNQYVTRTIPGSTETNVTVTVNNQGVNRQDNYPPMPRLRRTGWYKRLTVDNVATSAYPEVTITGVYVPHFAIGQSAVDSRREGCRCISILQILRNVEDAVLCPIPCDLKNKHVSVFRPSACSLSHAKHVSRWTVLTSQFSSNCLICLFFKRKLRDNPPGTNEDIVSSVTGSVFVAETTFLYDSWNLVREQAHKQTNTQTNFFTWGLDLSGSLQGAGGIGGLLASIGRAGSPSTPLFYTYDANGNVSELLDPDTGLISAHYEYSPFGETIVATGDMAKENPYRFSTKYTDDETKLVYYGYRYYSPDLGRWMNRDPIEEQSGHQNLYLMARNAIVVYIDILGLSTKTPCCAGVEYNPKKSCCENDKVVDMVKGIKRKKCCPAEQKRDTPAYEECIGEVEDRYTTIIYPNLEAVRDAQLATAEREAQDCAARCRSKYANPLSRVLCEYGCDKAFGYVSANIRTAHLALVATAILTEQFEYDNCGSKYPCASP